MYDDLPDYDNVQYDSFYGSAPPEPTEYLCDNDNNPGEFILERSRLSTDTVLCRDCVNTMGVEDDVMPMNVPDRHA